ncbi:hypothetical protein EYF80_006000 [Liparis tanakae]|uniref:Secreted protein n=1 Tax=Liparis tanakae TaxID=230148 RepID=A0A4Z2J1W9_9TELE|nr:hypothetical protein EYF80_006000 [Liparis tanakae]
MIPRVLLLLWISGHGGGGGGVIHYVQHIHAYSASSRSLGEQNALRAVNHMAAAAAAALTVLLPVSPRRASPLLLQNACE